MAPASVGSVVCCWGHVQDIIIVIVYRIQSLGNRTTKKTKIPGKNTDILYALNQHGVTTCFISNYINLVCCLEI